MDREAAATAPGTERDLLSRISTLYGIGDGTEATANHGRIEQILTTQRGAALVDGRRTLNNRFSASWLNNRQRVGDQGLAGGSVDRSNRRRMLAELFRGKASLALGADAADRTSRNAMGRRRMDLERQVKLGTAPNLDSINAVSEQRQDIDEAYRGLGQQALGDLFVTGGQIGYDAQVAQAQGRAGVGAYSLRRPATRSSGTYL